MGGSPVLRQGDAAVAEEVEDGAEVLPATVDHDPTWREEKTQKGNLKKKKKKKVSV